MREAQKVERVRLPEAPYRSSSGGVPAELDQPGLVGVQFQPELREPLTKIGQEPPRIVLILEAHDEESRRGESHPPPLAEPCVNLSVYTAPIVQPPGLRPKRQCANSRGDRREASAINSPARFSRRRNRLYLRIAQRTR